MNQFPQRKILPHETPPWVPSGVLYFITICGYPRGKNQFCYPDIAEQIFLSARFYNELTKWWARLLLLMPDHIHGLIAFSRDSAMKQIITAWKGYNAKHLRIRWQRDYFDHRLRNDENVQAKALYIRNNPARAGLIAQHEKWPYVLEN